MENNFALHGIDVSEWQGVIDWQKVAEDGVEFAMIRATHGLKKDVFFESNIKNAANVGIAVGVYCCSYATTIDRLLEETDFFLDAIRPYANDISFPAAFDAEQSSQFKLGKKMVTEMILTFCDKVADAGYIPVNYTNSNWLNNVIDKPALADAGIDVWVSWPKKVTNFENIPVDGVTKHEHTMWQFSSVGKINGIAGNVDLNISYVDYSKVEKNNGYVTWEEAGSILKSMGYKEIVL